MSFRRTTCATTLALAAAAVLVPSSAAAVQPRISSASVSEVGHNPGPDYFVTVTIRARVCAAKGPVTLRVRERKTLGGEVEAEHFRRYRMRNAARCQNHQVAFKLGDAFFGIGSYQLRLQASDRFGRVSRSVFRTHDTSD
jgi:hypothetical protein